jgi:hypothetical protein
VAHLCKALPAFYGGDAAAATRSLHEVLALHDPLRHAGHVQRYGTDPVVLSQSYLAWIHAADGDMSGARACADAAVERARSERHVFSICYALCFAASAAQLCGDEEAARRHAGEALQLGNRHNFQYWIAWAQAIEGWLVGLRAPELGVSLIGNARDRYLATGSTLVAPYFEALACRIARAAGLPEAGEREARLHAQARASGVRFWEAVLRERGPV